MQATAIKLAAVKSSRIAAAGYDEENWVLFLQFPTGAIYKYSGFEPMDWEAFQAAASLGTFFNTKIRGVLQYKLAEDGEAMGVDLAARTASAPKKEKAPVVGIVPELPEDDRELPGAALAILTKAQTFVITSPSEYENACAELLAIVAGKKTAQARVNLIKSPAYATYQAALQLEKEVVGRFTDAEAAIKRSIANWSTKAEQEKREKERQETYRLQQENQREADERASMMAKEDAARLRAQGQHAIAREVEANPLPVAARPTPQVLLQSETPKVAGVAMVKGYDFRIDDPAAVPDAYKTIDEKKIRGVVKSLGLSANIPGVTVFETSSVRASAGK